MKKVVKNVLIVDIQNAKMEIEKINKQLQDILKDNTISLYDKVDKSIPFLKDILKNVDELTKILQNDKILEDTEKQGDSRSNESRQEIHTEQKP